MIRVPLAAPCRPVPPRAAPYLVVNGTKPREDPRVSGDAGDENAKPFGRCAEVAHLIMQVGNVVDDLGTGQ